MLYKNELLELDILKYPEGVTIKKNIKYVMTARTERVRNHKILIATIYKIKSTNPEYIIFSDNKTWKVYFVDEERWSESTIESLIYYWSKCIQMADELSSNCGVEFFANNKSDTLEALNEFQYSIRARQLEDKKSKIGMRTKDVMNQIKELPIGFMKWINDVPLISSRYIYYKKNGKVFNAYCTNCKKDLIISEAKHDQTGRCPNCKSNITFKAIGRSTKISDSKTACIIETGEGKLKGTIIVRCFSIGKHYNSQYRNPTLHVHEGARYLIKNKTVYLFEYTSKYSQFYHRWEPCDWHQKKTPIINNKYYLYTQNLNNVLGNTSWKYSAIKLYAQSIKTSFNVLGYLDKYLEFPCIEYLVKLKLYKIVNQKLSESWHNLPSSVNFKGKNLKEVLGVNKEDISFLQKNNLSLEELKLYQIIRKRGYVCLASVIKFVRKYFVTEFGNTQDFEILEKLFYWVSPKKAVTYLQKQYTQDRLMSNLCRDWLDMINNAITLEYDVNSKSVLYPKNLKEAHDKFAELAIQKKNVKNTEVIIKMADELSKKYGFKKGSYIIKVPQSADEIISEGKKLHHCVGTYLEKIVKGETCILFLRKISEPNEPFYTIEIKNNKVQQIRGLHNCDMTPQVRKFIEQWKNKKISKLENEVRVRISA